MPVTAARFELSVDGHSLATFSMLEGLSAEIETVEYMTSSLDRLFLFQPIDRPPFVTLVRPQNSDASISIWNRSAARKNCVVAVPGQQGSPIARYHLENAWPSKIEIGGLMAGTSRDVLEKVTFTCSRIRRA